MCGPESFIRGSEKLTNIFGYWPSFHDAEIIELHLWRGNVNPYTEHYVFPVLTTKLHVSELTRETNSKGCLVLKHHTLATLRFHSVEDDFELVGFDHQNMIFALTIDRRHRDNGPSPFFAVEFQPSVGMGAKFKCAAVEVLDAVQCNEDGNIATG